MWGCRVNWMTKLSLMVRRSHHDRLGSSSQTLRYHASVTKGTTDVLTVGQPSRAEVLAVVRSGLNKRRFLPTQQMQILHTNICWLFYIQSKLIVFSKGVSNSFSWCDIVTDWKGTKVSRVNKIKVDLSASHFERLKCIWSDQLVRMSWP